MMVQRIGTVLRQGIALLVLALGASLLLPAASQAQAGEEYKKVFNQALEDAKAKQYQKAYDGFLKAAQMSRQAGDQETAQKALRIVAQLDYNFGLQAYRNNKFDQALNHYNKGIEHDAAFAKKLSR